MVVGQTNSCSLKYVTDLLITYTSLSKCSGRSLIQKPQVYIDCDGHTRKFSHFIIEGWIQVFSSVSTKDLFTWVEGENNGTTNCRETANSKCGLANHWRAISPTILYSCPQPSWLDPWCYTIILPHSYTCYEDVGFRVTYRDPQNQVETKLKAIYVNDQNVCAHIVPYRPWFAQMMAAKWIAQTNNPTSLGHLHMGILCLFDPLLS